MSNKHQYLSVMGTLGSGKTTVARLLAKELKLHLLEENFGENAFLPRFYQDMKRWAFHSQMFFLMEKIKQMMETHNVLEKHSVIQDTPIQQDAFSYAKAQYILENMDDAEWWLYQKVYRAFEPFLPTPDLIIYLETSLTTLVERIEMRGRMYERKIPLSYLELLDMLNHRWIKDNKTIRVVTVETDTLDIIHSKKARTILVSLVKSALEAKRVAPQHQIMHLTDNS